MEPGLVIVNKPVGPTSFEVVRTFKRIFFQNNIKKVGHFGSLDPLAEGVLLVGFNGAMKFNGMVQEGFYKTYVATGVFGLSTPTGDMDCPEALRESVGTGRAQGMDRGQLESFFREGFLGTYFQRPHRYSAAKYRGKPLYHYARRGMDVDKPPVKRFIKNLSILSWNYPEVVFEAQVGSGTYVRGLFEDFACSLGSRGALVGLKRTVLGPCLIEDAIGMQELDPAHLDRYAKSPAELFG